MAYIAPIIKDRVAMGYDKYQKSDSGDGKIILNSAPDYVLENGTDINKALLQPIADALQLLNTDILPDYALTYWKRRTVGGQYSSVESPAWVSENYEYYFSQIMYFNRMQSGLDQYGDLGPEYVNTSIQYSSAITVNQGNGAVSLKSPSTINIRSSYDGTYHVSPDEDTVNETLRGKYVKGIRPNTSAIFYLPTDIYANAFGRRYDVGYLWYFGIYKDNAIANSEIKVISSQYTIEYGQWEIVSSENPNQYPDSSTVDGYEWVKLGRIDEYVLNVLSQLDTRLSTLESLATSV